MLNRDRPIGQRFMDGYFFGIPDMAGSHWGRASARSGTEEKRGNFGWLDRTGMPHGRTGDKAARRAAHGTVGLRHGRGPHAGWHLKAAASRKKRR